MKRIAILLAAALTGLQLSAPDPQGGISPELLQQISRKGYKFQKAPSRFIINFIDDENTTERIPANHRGLPGLNGLERPVVR